MFILCHLLKLQKHVHLLAELMQDKKLKELFDTIPSLDDLYSLGREGLKADAILVDAEKDKKLSMLKQLSIASVKGLNTNPALLIKKIAGLVSFLFHWKYKSLIESMLSLVKSVFQELKEHRLLRQWPIRLIYENICMYSL